MFEAISKPNWLHNRVVLVRTANVSHMVKYQRTKFDPLSDFTVTCIYDP